VTIFPGMFCEFMRVGMVGKAIRDGALDLDLADLRDFAEDRHSTVDDRPFGGGAGMVMKADVLDRAIASCKGRSPDSEVVFLTPQGRTLDQHLLREMSAKPGFVLVSGRYQGIDQRVIDKRADAEISIGDYVLSGGEVPAMALIEGVARLLEGVVGNHESLETDTFWEGLLAPPMYTRPAVWEGIPAPEALLSGNHERISSWRRDQALAATKQKRPDIAIPEGEPQLKS